MLGFGKRVGDCDADYGGPYDNNCLARKEKKVKEVFARKEMK